MARVKQKALLTLRLFRLDVVPLENEQVWSKVSLTVEV
jgi:hypothetical protein